MLRSHKNIRIMSTPNCLNTIIWKNSNLWYTSSNYFYFDLYYQNFQEQIHNHRNINPYKKSLISTYEDIHDEWFIHHKFSHLHTLSFTEFFISHNIDIPVCFQNSKSLNRYQRELKFVNFITYFMRHGKKLQMQNIILKTCSQFIFHNFFQKSVNTNYSWKAIFFLTQSLLNIYTQSSLYLTMRKIVPLAYNHRGGNFAKNISFDFDFTNILFRNLLNLLPMFSFYIYKVDKKIFKNTRGKSGKYTFIWKFITPYKRLSWAMYWLAKELKIKSGKTLEARLNTLYTELVFNPKSMWISKVKRFSYNYVYRNARTTLAESYRTTTK